MFVAFYLVGKCDYVATFFFRSFVAHHGFNLWDGSGQNTVEVQFSVNGGLLDAARMLRPLSGSLFAIFSASVAEEEQCTLSLPLSLLDCT